MHDYLCNITYKNKNISSHDKVIFKINNKTFTKGYILLYNR